MSSAERFQSVRVCLSAWPILGTMLIFMFHEASGQLDPIRGAPPPPNHSALERYFNLLSANRRHFNGDFEGPSSFWRAYRGTWLRTNFEDWIGTRQDWGQRSKEPSNYPEWFETKKEDLTCSVVPAAVNAGRPPSDICLNAQSDEKRCICIKQHGSKRGDYKPVCGQCRDPCALRFVPKSSYEYLQRLTLGTNDEDVDTETTALKDANEEKVEETSESPDTSH